jgi:hypothetical protein
MGVLVLRRRDAGLLRAGVPMTRINRFHWKAARLWRMNNLMTEFFTDECLWLLEYT